MINKFNTLEHRLYFRFLKNERCYYKRFIDFIHIGKRIETDLLKLFDLTCSWANTPEGHLFWYKKQIDLTIFLIKMNYNDFNLSKNYLERLLNGYSHASAINTDWYKCAVNFLKNECNI